MSRLQKLLELCERWRALSEREGEGIKAADWDRVTACQRQKQDLQAQITDASLTLREQAEPDGAAQSRIARQFRKTGEELIALERRNTEWLRLQKGSTQIQFLENQQTRSNLQKVHKAYATPAQPLWNRFS